MLQASEYNGAPAPRAVAPVLILGRLTPAQAVLVLIAATGLLRIVLAAVTGLGSDESYSVANARTWSLSYVDHPPLHLWIAGWMGKLAGSEHALVVRLPFIALFAGSTWLMFRLTELLFGARAGVWAALILNLAPQLTLAAGSWVLPDGPVDFFLLAGTYVVARLMFAGPTPSAALAPWLVAGALGGLAMLSKFHGAFLFAGTFVFLLSWRPARHILATPAPWLAALVGLAVFSPVIVWNAQNEWVGLFFQSRRVADPENISVLRVLESIAGQALFLLPWILAGLAYVWLKALAAGPRSPRSWLLVLVASGPILAFTLAGLLRRSLPHWPIPGWLMTIPLLGQAMARLAETRPQLAVRAATGTAALLLAIIGTFALHASTGWLTGPMQALGVRSSADPMLELMDWREVAGVLAARGLIDDATPAAAGPHWIDAGKLNYAIGRQTPVLCVCANPQHFRFLRPEADFAGKDILLIGRPHSIDRWTSYLGQRFSRLEPLEPIVLSRAGRPALTLEVTRGVGFRPQ